MKLVTHETPSSHPMLEVVIENPTAEEVIKDLSDAVQVGQRLSGIKRDTENKPTNVNRFELRPVGPNTSTLTIDEDFQEVWMGYGNPQAYIKPKIKSDEHGDQSYHGTFLILNGEVVSADSSEPTTFVGYQGKPTHRAARPEELSDRDREALATWAREVADREMEIAILPADNPRVFGEYNL